jgi:hypothetical protein
MDDATRALLGLPTGAQLAATAKAVAERLERELAAEYADLADERGVLHFGYLPEGCDGPVTVACNRR